jgi:hypothetical protein
VLFLLELADPFPAPLPDPFLAPLAGFFAVLAAALVPGL